MKSEFIPEKRATIVDPVTGKTKVRITAPYHPALRAANRVAYMRELARAPWYSPEERRAWTKRADAEALDMARRARAARRAAVSAPQLPRPQVSRAPRRARVTRPVAALSGEDGPPGPPRAESPGAAPPRAEVAP